MTHYFHFLWSNVYLYSSAWGKNILFHYSLNLWKWNYKIVKYHFSPLQLSNSEECLVARFMQGSHSHDKALHRLSLSLSCSLSGLQATDQESLNDLLSSNNTSQLAPSTCWIINAAEIEHLRTCCLWWTMQIWASLSLVVSYGSTGGKEKNIY